MSGPGTGAGTPARLVDIDALVAKLSATGRNVAYWTSLLFFTALAFTMAVLAPIARTGAGRAILIAVGVASGGISLLLPEARKRREVKRRAEAGSPDKEARITAEAAVEDLQLSLDLSNQLAVDLQTKLNVAMRDSLAPDIAAVHDLLAANAQERVTKCGAMYHRLITTTVAMIGMPLVRAAFYAVERGAARNSQTLMRKTWTGRGDEPRKTITKKGTSLERRIWDFMDDPGQRLQSRSDVTQGTEAGQYAGKRYRSLVALKVVSPDGECLGLLAVDSPDAGAFIEGQADLLYPLAELFGIVQTLMA